MKEFAAQTGGRYTYVDDVLNLQNLALAFSSIFDECDNFIISGCNVSGTSISDGYVYINGKIRHFPGSSGLNWPQYIYESNKTESVAYENGTDKVGRNVYGCMIAKTVPTVNDPITGSIPQSIVIQNTGGKRIKDALFGKYSLILNPASGVQEINGDINFTGNVNVDGVLSTKNRVSIQSGDSIGQIYYDKNNFIIQSKSGSGPVFKIVLSNDDGFVFYVGNEIVFTADNKSINFKKPISSDSGKFGNVKMIGNDIYDSGISADDGFIYINKLGHDGTNAYFRNTYIGNGKGAMVLSVDGKNSLVNIGGGLNVSGTSPTGITLRASDVKTNNSLQKILSWEDSLSSQIGYIGYNSVDNKIFEIYNDLESILIKGNGFVNIAPAIKENGVFLSDKYLSKTAFNTEISKYAKTNDVYGTEYIDDNCSKFSGGLSQFIVGKTTKSTLRSQIDAISMSDATEKFPELSKCLSDMATSENLKKQICANIGATYGNEYQTKLKDTGWIKINADLAIRQIGNIVSIQGYITTIHDGTIFSIPLTIDPPTYATSFSTVTNSNTGHWRCYINAYSRNCTVGYCNNHGIKIPFSLTYMV